MPLPLYQAWLAQPTPDFAPAIVRTGWRDDTLFVFARMTDEDIRTRVTADNQRFWELGDTFEIFLRPIEQASYVEFHVAPTNHRLQLRFADGEWTTRLPRVDPFATSLVPGQAFQSHAWARPGEWCVLAEIPGSSVCDSPGPLPGSSWAFSFSRYDETDGRDTPVISSTSPHAAPSFHRQHEWGLLRFVPSGTPPD